MINEFDINDWEQLPITPLYEVNRASPISVDNSMYFFSHLDGAYSICYTLDGESEICHLAAWTPVIPYARINKQKKAS